jgi:hypothetical protein
VIGRGQTECALGLTIIYIRTYECFELGSTMN